MSKNVLMVGADFVHLTQHAMKKPADTPKQISEEDSGLCCCEYIDRENNRFHILGCCCNCQDFDLLCTRVVLCQHIDPKYRRNMLLTFQDRLRIPWRGGAKQVSPEALVAAITVPLVIALAAINCYTALIMLLATICFLTYGLQMVKRAQTRTGFFAKWNFFSCLYMAILFEQTVPLLELLPEEKVVLMLLAIVAIVCFWRAIQLAPLNHVTQTTSKDELPGITEASTAEEEAAAAQTALLLEHDKAVDSDSVDVDLLGHQPNICEYCRKYMPTRTEHCSVCGACIMRKDHHSYWLDCCIGERNHRLYLAGLVFSLLTLLLGANLTLTAVCHPFLVVRFLGVPVMLPDDCSEVFDDYELAVSFIIAGYAIVMSVYVSIALLRQFYYISRGTTMQECQRGHCGNRKTFLTNWKAFIY